MLPGELADARKRDEDEVVHFEAPVGERGAEPFVPSGSYPVNTAILPQEPEWRPKRDF